MELSFYTIDDVCSAIDLTQEKPVVDLSKITFVRPFALVYLGMFLRYHNQSGKYFKILLPKDNTVRTYLSAQKFWERFNFNPDTIEREKLVRLTNQTSLNNVIDIEKRDDVPDEVAAGVLKILRSNGVNVPVIPIAEMVSELVDNFVCHSQRTLAAVAMQYYPKMHQVAFAVGDCGVGIRSSLSSNPSYAHFSTLPHREAALKAFEPLVSCKPYGGMGLTEVAAQTSKLGGFLKLSTGNGYVRISKASNEYGEMSFDLPGVQVELTFNEKV